MLVGIDLDNTIIRYDKSLHRIALERGLIGTDIPMHKRAVRDEIRRVYGDEEWQKLQVAIYGDSIGEAELVSGVWEFLLALEKAGHSFQIVSHKTRYPNYGKAKVDLRESALSFLEKKGFFSADGLNMKRHDIFFLSTREAKVEKIKDLGCELFIDDLEEVFAEPGFPSGVYKVLFSPENENYELDQVAVFSTFKQISDYTFMTGDGRND
ncbi:hypothetical protein [Maridesulfovibrio hydrothermalis]|uniref:Uncharacterized protein n=1 Tax=Maridesulfovibrio hydrothermalis AM13 = DSM 14728 TaxID=1121451 RepID=L0RD37_9BACT|nr:hypothetical protein [Maridesulfovibrio hydrothermalis]CCO23451.1 conserved protein of unknown function [Maridesulfovibrio hydrothermalis AM13 = DSM 14728]